MRDSHSLATADLPAGLRWRPSMSNMVDLSSDLEKVFHKHMFSKQVSYVTLVMVTRF